MLDTALMDALAHGLRAQPARAMAEYGESLPDFQKRALKELASFESHQADRVAEGARIREELSDRLAPALNEPGTWTDVAAHLDSMIAKLEAFCLIEAAEFDEAAKSARRQIKRASALGHAERDVIKSLADRSMAIMQADIDERGDFLLFLSAWRAKFTDESPSPTFSDPMAMRRYLEAALAS